MLISNIYLQEDFEDTKGVIRRPVHTVKFVLEQLNRESMKGI
jgi:hypothetical protein